MAHTSELFLSTAWKNFLLSTTMVNHSEQTLRTEDTVFKLNQKKKNYHKRLFIYRGKKWSVLAYLIIGKDDYVSKNHLKKIRYILLKTVN